MADHEPIPMVWNSEECRMEVRGSHRSIARRQFVHGEVYPMDVKEERSLKSLGHYHAAIKNAWENLRDEDRYTHHPKTGEVEDKYPSPDKLRKWALIKLGYRKERHIVCDTPEQAERLMPMVQPIDDDAIVVLKGNTIKMYTARSQSMHGRNAMTKEEFQKSKTEVLDLLAETIGVSRSTLEKAGEAA